MKGRAFRRHQEARAKDRAKRLLLSILQLGKQWVTDTMISTWAGNRQPCSCPMCGNPRKWFRHSTRKEKNAFHPIQE